MYNNINFYNKVYETVKRIPKGRVATYGQIAALCGSPRAARIVGSALHHNPQPVVIPCHRVVNKEGRTAPGWSRQRTLLEEEDVRFKPNGHVDMALHLWEPPME